MEYTIVSMQPEHAAQVSALMQAAFDRGEVLYQPMDAEKVTAVLIGEKKYGFCAVDGAGKVLGFVHGSCKTSFLNGENDENTPLYLTMIIVDNACRGQGIGTALLAAIRDTGRKIGKKSVVISGDNPVHLTWIIPGTPGHDHNNAPGVWEESGAQNWLASRGFTDNFHEISLYINLDDFKWDPALDQKIESMKAENIRIGIWEPSFGREYDGMCDRVGSEYWRNVLKTELAAWDSGKPNADPELWPDGRCPEGPRPMLTAAKDGALIGFTGPVDKQKSGRGWFTGIFVDPDFGGRGIASVLFSMLMREFIGEGAQFCSIFTGAANHAQKIYLRAGLHITSHWCIMSSPLSEGESWEHKYF